MIINAENKILGRLAAFAAKQALLGETVKIVNCEKAVISGNKADVFEKFRARRNRGIPLGGPYYRRSPEQIVKRSVRGMLPYKKGKGKSAYKNILCYSGVPADLANESFTEIEGADYSKLQKTRITQVKEISKELGAKI
ncbi:MAG: 50S ribosomal protein L13 [Candidatus Nanoarchaeia archaeon]